VVVVTHAYSERASRETLIQRMNYPLKDPLFNLLFFSVRFLPLFSALVFCDLSSTSDANVRLILDSFLRAAAVLALWRASEGVFLLWVREKNSGSSNSRGYGAVTIIIAAIVLLLLQSFRSQSTQIEFLVLLSALAFSGMAQSGWQQGRPVVALLAAPASHSALALLSFIFILDTPSWQAYSAALSVGLFTGAVESTKHGAKFYGAYPRWVLPFYRASLSFPPFAIGSLSMLKFLPSAFTASFGVLLLTTRFTWKSSDPKMIPASRSWKLLLIYLLFALILIIAQLSS
jgi:hypothetical protein